MFGVKSYLKEPEPDVLTMEQLQMTPWMAMVPPKFEDIAPDEHKWWFIDELIPEGTFAEGAQLYKINPETGEKTLIPESEDYRGTGSIVEQAAKGAMATPKDIELIMRDVLEHGGGVLTGKGDNPYVDTMLDQMLHVYTHPFESDEYADARNKAIQEGSLTEGDVLGSIGHAFGWVKDSWDKEGGWKSQVEQQHDKRWGMIGEAYTKYPAYYTANIIVEAARMVAPVKPAWYIAQQAKTGLKIGRALGYTTPNPGRAGSTGSVAIRAPLVLETPSVWATSTRRIWATNTRRRRFRKLYG